MQDVFKRAESFLLESKACKKAMKALKQGSAIQILIDQRNPIGIVKGKKDYLIKNLMLDDYDVLIKIHPDAFRLLTEDKDLDLSHFSVLILKQILIGKIDLDIKASLLHLIRKGYFKIAILAGSPFRVFLADYGLKHMNQIYAWIEAKRSKKN